MVKPWRDLASIHVTPVLAEVQVTLERRNRWPYHSSAGWLPRTPP